MRCPTANSQLSPKPMNTFYDHYTYGSNFRKPGFINMKPVNL